jgi:hypothetical protein
VSGQYHRIAEGAAELMATDPAGEVERADGTMGVTGTAERPPAGAWGPRGQARPGGEPTVPSDGRDKGRNDLFDDIVDGLIDADIRATTRL